MREIAMLLAFLIQDDPLKVPCDQAAPLLAAAKAKEAAGLLAPHEKAAAATKSPSRDRFFYYLGCAAFAEGNDLLAGRSLAALAPFENPLYGAHTRYLLGRLHHRAGELVEAAANYDAVPAAFEKMPPAAKNPPPDFVGDAAFHGAVLLYERKAFADALARFQAVIQKEKRPAILEEARLRAGMSQARLLQGGEAVKTLAPLLAHPKLARAARWWTAQSILGAADGKPGDAAEHLKKALEAPAGEAGPEDAELLLALGGALDRAGRGGEAVGPYQKLLASNTRVEEALSRLVGAHVAAKQYREAEAAGARFAKDFAASPLLGEVLVRLGDVAYAEGQANAALLPEAVKRYERALAVAAGPAAGLARYRMGASLYRMGKLPEALAAFRGIPDADRVGDAAHASLLQAECILRTVSAPEDAADALKASEVLKDLNEAVAHLSRVQGAPGSPNAEVLLFKLAQAQQQVAAVLSEPGERAQAANTARGLYETFRAQYPNHALRPNAEYERANCYALAGDPTQGLQKLARFHGEPFASAPIAPLALIREAQLFRAANNPAQAVAVLNECRTKYEAALRKDPARAGWVPMLLYQLAASMKAANQGAQALPLLESLLKEFGTGEWAGPAQRLQKEIKP